MDANFTFLPYAGVAADLMRHRHSGTRGESNGSAFRRCNLLLLELWWTTTLWLRSCNRTSRACAIGSLAEILHQHQVVHRGIQLRVHEPFFVR
jgi:hypothetical protein